ncbi:hypothetical protein BSKO_07974 [Bryopsis sp. KO-2023]|nr:hypothetical protein BSKO_07974 [Bryopsis sp. KO-2023]
MATIVAVWVPALVFGNLFALVWLLFASATSPLKKIISGRRLKDDNHDNDDDTHGQDDQSQPEITSKDGKQSARVSPVVLEWKNICSWYSRGGAKVDVLRKAQGSALPGEMTAIMGPSGAGKSTLLDILTRRKECSAFSGSVLVNGEPIGKTFTKMASYVPQEDHFVPLLTALETVQFYAGLMLTPAMNKDEINFRVSTVLSELGLTLHQSTTVGGVLPGGLHLRGLSGGQKRRLSIAVGIIAAPSILFLDEPTSGLDSFTALNVMQYLRTLAVDFGHTVVISIHQPRIEIWNMFNSVVMLSRGRTMYVGAPDGVVPWFSETLGYKYDNATDGFAAEWAIDLISTDFDKPMTEPMSSMHSEHEIEAAANSFVKTHLAQDLEGNPMVGLTQGGKGGGTVDVKAEENDLKMDRKLSNGSAKNETSIPHCIHASSQCISKRLTTSWTHCTLLSWRTFLSLTRNPSDVSGRMLTATWIATFIGAIFYDLPKDASGMLTRFQVLFLVMIILILFPYLSVALVTSDRQFFLADMSARLYSPSTYYFCKSLVHLPFNLMNAGVFIMIVYGMTGLREDIVAWGKHVVILLLAFLIFVQILQLSATVVSSADLAFMLGVGVIAVNLLFANFFIRKEDMAFPWMGNLRSISAMGYAFEGVATAEMADREFSFPCDTVSDSTTQLSSISGISPGAISFFADRISEENGETCTMSGDTILEFFSHNMPFTGTVGILGLFLLLLHLGTCIVLLYLGRRPNAC